MVRLLTVELVADWAPDNPASESIVDSARIAATRPAEPFPSHLFDATRVPPCDADLATIE